ncbi:ECF transporter S component [Facklamia sp. P12934]|uniref:ECF transporter S component n=1 Tax=Facklamia sp. P12934 TaxID=3421948 RepID=UPI003D166F57
MSNNKTFKYVQIGIYAALIIAAITFIRVPMPSAISNSFVHPGNALVILAVLLMGFKRGTAAALIGLFLFDSLNGYFYVVHFTLLENLLVLIMVSFIYKKFFHKKDSMSHIVTLGIVGALTKIVLIFGKHIINQMILGATSSAAIAMAISAMPASLFTGLVTAILVPVLYFPLKKIFQRYHTIGE